MASKRAVQLLSLRTSYVILRSQCAPAPPRITSQALSRVIPSSRTPFGLGQRRWESNAAGNTTATASKVYEFEDIQKLSTHPSTSSPTSPLLIDVRESHEYKPSHIPTAINIPISSQPDALLLSPEDFEDRFGFEKPDVEREVVFYCKAGVRSRFAADVAKRAGFRSVGEYPGSWVDWVGRGGKEER